MVRTSLDRKNKLRINCNTRNGQSEENTASYCIYMVLDSLLNEHFPVSAEQRLHISVTLHLWIKIPLVIHFLCCYLRRLSHVSNMLHHFLLWPQKGLFWQCCEDPWLVLALVLIEAEIPSAVFLSILPLIDVLSEFWNQKVSSGLKLSIISTTAIVCCCLVVGFSVFGGCIGYTRTWRNHSPQNVPVTLSII